MNRRAASPIFAFAAAAAFAVGLSRFALAPLGMPSVMNDGQVLGAIVAALPHLLLLVGVWPVLTVRWRGRAGGLIWFGPDLASDVLALAGLSPQTYLMVRFAGHLGAAAWLIDSSRLGRGAFRLVGVVTGSYLAGYTALSAWLPPIALATSGPLLVLWCVLLGRHLRQASA